MGKWLPKDVREQDLPRPCTICDEIKLATDFYSRPCGRRRECCDCWDAITAAQPSSNLAKANWAMRNPTKRIAHNCISNGLRDGIIVRPDYCQECGANGCIQGHHDDYAKPLVVRWLCHACHHKWHARHGSAKNG